MDGNLTDVLQQLQNGQQVEKYTLKEGLLRKNNKIVVGPDEQLRSKILSWQHASPEGGHSGKDATLRRVKALFFWKGLSSSVRQYIKTCKTCQAAKSETIAKPGHL